MSTPIYPGGGRTPQPPPPFPNPPTKPSGPSNSMLGSNPGLLTSTGGLFGTNGVLLTPVVNLTTGSSYIMLMNSQDFNCEEDGEYDYPQYIPEGHEGEDVTCHLIMLKYRELGYAKFTVSVTAYQRGSDTFKTVSQDVTIPPIPLSKSRKQNFPDYRLHTLYLPIDITGERPQLTLTFKGSNGPHSVPELTLCGNADQTKQR